MLITDFKLDKEMNILTILCCLCYCTDLIPDKVGNKNRFDNSLGLILISE